MSRHLFLFVCLPALLPLRADGLSDLKTRLRALESTAPIKTQVKHETWNRSGDPKKPVVTQGDALALVEDGPQGLRITWSSEQLQLAVREARARTLDPEKTTPTRDAIASMDTLSIQECFYAGPGILQQLEGAKLLEDRADVLDGQPVRLLSLKIEPRLSTNEKKYVKELESTAKFWLDPGGLPIGAERHTKVRGRALMVISFQSDERDEYRFAHVTNRLITVRHTHENSASGGGESTQSRQVTTVTLN